VSIRPQGPPLLLPSITLISAAALSYEILLMRLLSIIQWHHFAYMIISLALLGYGMSGTFLTFARQWGSSRFEVMYVANAVLFGMATLVCFSLAQQIPFNGLELVWNPRQIGWLVMIYLLLTLPFFFAANCLGLAFIRFSAFIHRIYRWDLIGAGTGGLAVISMLFVFTPPTCMQLLAVSGLFGGTMILLRRQWDKGKKLIAAASIGVAVLIILWPSNWLELNITPYKGLPLALQVSGAKVVDQYSSPLGLLTIVENPEIPFRYTPGLSLASSGEPPPQLGVFTDGDSMSAITRFEGNLAALSYLDALSSALPYHLLEQPRVLILGAGGGSDVLQALYHQASSIDAVELNPQMVDLVRTRYADFAGHLYDHPRVKIHIAEARGYLADHTGDYDLIQIALLDSFVSSGAGTHALSENYLYTVEALIDAYRNLRENGLLAITRWLKLPPRDALKLFATAQEALHRTGITHPGKHLALTRSWQTTTLLVKKGELSDVDVTTIRAFSAERYFDVAYFPGITHEEVNRFNVLQEPYFYQGTQALLGAEREAFIEDYKFNLTPPTDNQPYFFHFFKWRILPELFTLRDQGGLVLLDSGYLILITTLLQAIPVSIILILMPLLAILRHNIHHRLRWRPAIYFTCLGLAFLFIEIAFIQRFILFVSHPLYAAAVVLTGFLVFAGLGSGSVTRIQRRLKSNSWSAVDLAVAAISSIALIYLIILPTLLASGTALPMIFKLLITLVLIAPLAFFMGMPFPLGLARLAEHTPEIIPWAWGINGCASVLSAILATIIAIHFGFQAVIGFAVMLYVIAVSLWR
jgi:spermidine synthase